MIRDFRTRFYIASVLTIPILALSPLVQELLGFTLTFRGAGYVRLGLASAVYVAGGWPFLSGALDELRARRPGMMTLIGLAITVAYCYSAAVTLGLQGSPFFWELATLIVVMLGGHWIEMRSVLSASNALQELAQLMPETAHRKRGGEVDDVPLAEVDAGDVLVIKPGEKVPADGTIVGGHSFVDESMLTGESQPVEKGEGDELIGGAVNGDGALEIEVGQTGEDSYLSQVIELVRASQQAKSQTQGLADRAALWLTAVAITAGAVTLAVWLALGRDLQFAIARMATVMVITCPHALGLAIPLVAAVSTSRSAQNGLLIRNRTAFENARNVTTVLFDKTGTLTTGSFAVADVAVHAGDGYDEQEVLRLAAAVEQRSEHPLARGIVERAAEDELAVDDADDFEAIQGKGVVGSVAGRAVAVVSHGYLQERDVEVPSGAEPEAGVTRVFVMVDDEVVGSIGLADEIRPQSAPAVRMLQQRGVHCSMITGDNQATAAAVAQELGLDGTFAEVLPHQKQDKVAELQDGGEVVAMTGDGVNDAPALAKADVGIAIGSGTDVAAETADIVLVDSNPQDVTSVLLFGRATYRKMVQNLLWATGYNVVAIPLAAGALYGFGILLSPAVGAILMSVSTVVVAVNARFLQVEQQAGD